MSTHRCEPCQQDFDELVPFLLHLEEVHQTSILDVDLSPSGEE